MTKIITVSLRERKIVPAPQKRAQVPGDGSLWWLNVTTLWMSTLYYFVWHISNKRRQNPSERQHKQRYWAERQLERQRDQLQIMQAACQYDLWVGGWGGGG